MAANLTLSDYVAMRNLAFDWADSYDTKNWDLLRQCLAPSIRLDFRNLQGSLHEALTPDEYVEILVKMIGDKKLRTQHFIGATKTECLDDGSVKVEHQIRVAHQRYENEDLGSAVTNKGHGHGVTTHWYKKFGCTWKIAGASSKLYWSEYDLFGTLNLS
ncbi:putative Scytalone dehydratase [Seiridium cardinale]|uniref:Scytalone dehydratase n=1 Tax=Seiridium cardinale TaxID=138064 RepID=A0ABR2XR53_9PEZI